MTDIKWFDGKDAKGKFILEMNFANGGKSYLKNESYEQVCHWYDVLWGSPELIAMTLFNTEGKVVAAKNKTGIAA